MRPLAALFALAAPPAPAADKDEDKAREVAVAFLKAVKARDVDAAMKTADVPFLVVNREKPTTFEKVDELKADLKTKLEGIKDTDIVPTDVTEILGREGLRKTAKEKAEEEVVKMIEKAIGETGYVVRFGKEGAPKKTYVLVRIKDGKAKVVGMPG